LTIYDLLFALNKLLPLLEIVVITFHKLSDLFPEITSRFLSASALFSFQGTSCACSKLASANKTASLDSLPRICGSFLPFPQL